jgi:ABC-type glycerol-3-phosphate transport system substrate-binding protein
MQKLILSFFILVSVLFLNCSQKSKLPELSILIRMMPAQEKYFTEEVIPKFEKENNCRIKVVTFGDMWDIESTLKLEKGSRKPTISLVKTPFEMTRVLVGKGYMTDLASVVDTMQLEQDIAEYHPLALGLGYIDNHLYYLPRKLETRILFYLKSRVAEAVKKYPDMKKEISQVLQKENGYGLPAGYTLEEDPNLWDFYDLFVIGYIWSNTTYFDLKMPRIAFRGAKYEGTALGLIDNAIQLGATGDDIVKLVSDPMIRMYQWHSEWVKNRILNPAMWQDPYRGVNLWEGFRDGKLFLTTAQQIDCFFIHGWDKNIEMPGYMKNPEDMGLALMPQGVSFELTRDGKYKMTGERKITTGGWWWGIPKTAPYPQLAYKLERFITSHEIQAQECSRFGMMPVRKDILNNLGEVFERGWVGDIFMKSAEQIQINDLTTIPLSPHYSDIGRNVIDAWYGICVPGGEMIGPITDLDALRKALSGKYMDVQRKISGNDISG